MRALSFTLFLCLWSIFSFAAGTYPVYNDARSACSSAYDGYTHNSNNSSCTTTYSGTHYNFVVCTGGSHAEYARANSYSCYYEDDIVIPNEFFYGSGSCPAGSEPDPNDYNKCNIIPIPVAGDTMTGECHSWQDDCINQDYVDENGTIWTNDGVAICDGDTCINQWTNSGTQVDLNDPDSWPENTTASTDDSTPTGLGAADELSPFDNYDPGAAGEITTESDSSTTTNSDGSGSTTQTDTRLKNDGTKEETTTTVETDSSGGTTTTTTTKTTSQNGSTTTQSDTEVKDSGGTVTSTSSTTSSDEEGEQEDDPSKVSGGGSCAAKPVCEGDAVQCAILLQDWNAVCGNLTTDFVEPVAPDFATKLAAVEAEFDAVVAQIDADIHTALDLTLSASGTIQPNIISIFGVDIDFSFYRWLSELAVIGTIILALAWLSALFIILTGRG